MALSVTLWLTAVATAAAVPVEPGESVRRAPAQIESPATQPETAVAAPGTGRTPPIQYIDPRDAELLRTQIAVGEVIWQRAKAVVDDNMRRSRETLLQDAKEINADTFTRAGHLVTQGRNALESAKNVAPAGEYQRLAQELKSLDAYIADQREAWNQKQVVLQQLEARKIEAMRRKEAEARRQNQIDELMERARQHHMAREYAKAIHLLDEVLRIDPNNKAAQWQRDTLSVTDKLAQNYQADVDRSEWTSRAFIGIRRSMIPEDDPITFPSVEVWRELCERRKQFEISGEPPESAANMRVREQMQKNVFSVTFPQGMTFEKALEWLREFGHVNINANWSAMEALGYTKNHEVPLQLRDVTFETALRELLSKVAGREKVLDYMIRDGIIKISTKDDLDQMKYILVYDCRDVLHPVEDFQRPIVIGTASRTATNTNNNTSGGAGFGGGGGAGGGFGGGLIGGEPGGSETGTNPIRDKKVTDFKDLVRKAVLPDSWAPAGQADMTESDGLLVVNQTSEGHRELARLLKQLREHSKMQINIEARFLHLDSQFLEDIGIDLDIIFNRNPGPNSRHGAIPVNVETFPHGNFDRMTGSFTNLTEVGNPDIFSLGRSSLLIAGSFLDDLQVDFFIRATQAHRQASRLNSLRVTLMNGHEAYVRVAELQDYVSDLDAVVAENSVAYEPVIGQLTRGMTFGVRATVSADRKYVIMTVWPTLQDERIFGSYDFIGGTTIFPGLDPTGTSTSTIADDFGIRVQLGLGTVQEVRTTVMVPDKGTLLLGGHRRVDELEVENGVPMLSKIPIIKRFFTYRSFVKREMTLLMLIRPQIIIPEEIEP